MATTPKSSESPGRIQDLETQVAELNRRLAALTKSEHTYREMVQSANSIILCMDTAGNITFINSYGLTFFGFTREELLFRSVVGTIVPATDSTGRDLARMIEEITFNPERFHTNENENCCKSGRRVWIAWTNKLFDHGEDQPLILCVGNDITMRRLAEQAAAREQERSDFALRASGDGIWDWDIENNRVYYSPRWKAVLGYEEHEVPNDFSGWENLVHPEDLARAQAAIDASFATRNHYYLSEFRMRCKDGSWKWILARGSVVAWSDDDRPLRMLGTHTDITELRRAKDELQTTQALLQAAILQSSSGILIADAPDVRIRLANPAALGIRGPTDKQLTDIDISRHTQSWQTFHPDGRPYLPEDLPLSRAVLHGTVVENEDVIIRREDGEDRWVSANAAPVWDGHGNIIAGIIVFHDITDRIQGEKEHARLSQAVEQADEGILITDAGGTIEYVNPAFERIAGRSQRDLVGQHTSILKSTEHAQQFYTNMMATILAGTIWKGRISLPRPGRGPINVDATYSPLKNAAGDITNFVAIMRDITREVAMEHQLRQAQKMEAIGTLAGGISHDFNNILAAIIGYTEICLDETAGQPELQHNLNQILQAGNRAKELVQQILAFSRQDEQEYIPVSITPIITESARLLRASLPATIEMSQTFTAERDIVLADPTQIHQILINLCMNAGDAMRDRPGTIAIDLRERTLTRENTTTLDPALEPGRYLELSVRDTGTGMSDEVLEHLFEPYFTTKAKGKGTGLGLAVVHGIVKSYRGCITVQSLPGEGTTVSVYLPAALSTDTPAPAAAAALPTGSENILIIDDERDVALVLERSLKALGYRAVAHTSPRAALDDFRRCPDQFDLVLTDKTMPQMTGFTLARAIRDIRPDIPVLMATGLTEDVDADQVQQIGINALVSKPLNRTELARKVRSVLDGMP